MAWHLTSIAHCPLGCCQLGPLLARYDVYYVKLMIGLLFGFAAVNQRIRWIG